MVDNRLIYRELIPYLGAMGFVITLSNVLVQYPLGNWLTYGALTYPFAFLITDLVNRSYGLVCAKRVIIVGAIAGIITSLVATLFDLTTLRIAIASAMAFMIAQYLDVKVFDRLRHLSWWQTPAISSAFGSVVDSLLFFSIAFSATSFMVLPDGNDWTFILVPVLGFGRELPLWVSLAVADLGIKLLMVICLLLPYRLMMSKQKTLN